MTVWGKFGRGARAIFTDRVFLSGAALTIVCTFLAAFLAVMGTEHLTLKSDNRADADEYFRSVGKFDESAQAYAGMVLASGKVDEPSRDRLQASVLEQQHTLQKVQHVLPPSQRALTGQYSEALTELSGSVDHVTGVADMKPYWQSLNHVLVLRHDLDADFTKVREHNG